MSVMETTHASEILQSNRIDVVVTEEIYEYEISGDAAGPRYYEFPSIYQFYDSIDVNSSTVMTTNETRLCGAPGLCKVSALRNCVNVTLNQCWDCSSIASIIFAIVIACIGLVILIGNALIISVSIHLSKNRSASQMDWMKLSLAVADIMTALLIFFVALPNWHWSLTSTVKDIETQQKLLRGSGVVVAASSIYVLGRTSSLYHLVFFGFMRIYAIVRPHQYKMKNRRRATVGIFSVWLVAAVVTSLPAWFPSYFSYDYHHVTFLYLPSLIPLKQERYNFGGMVMLCILFLMPLLLITFLMLSTAAIARTTLQASSRRLHSSRTRGSVRRHEIATFKNVAVMQFGFSITAVPLGVVAALMYADIITCKNLSTPYLISFYISMTNSLVNIFVYSAKEKRFRAAVYDMLQNRKALSRKKSTNTRSTHFRQKSKSTATASASKST